MGAARENSKFQYGKSSKSKDDIARVRPKGASRKPEKVSSVPIMKYVKGSIKYLVAAGSIASVFALIFWLNPGHKLEEFTHKPIKEVIIEGRFHFFDKEEAQAIIREHVAGSFIDLDIQKLKLNLEENPWVDSVLISREWPDKLIIKITEQQAIARWGESKFLNVRGDIISLKNAKKMDDLPFLNGNDSYAKDVMKQYLRMGKLLQKSGLQLNNVELDETLSWKLIVNGSVTIKLGRERIWEKLQNLMLAKNGVLNETFSQIKKIDMRYPSGFAVEWKEEFNHYAVEN